MSQLINKDGIEYPTHTTPHNQVVVANIPNPSDDTLRNYVQLKQERDMSWDQVAAGVAVQDPALADYLRAHGAEFEKGLSDDGPAKLELVTELAHNPLSTPEERDAADNAAKGAAPAKAAAKK